MLKEIDSVTLFAINLLLAVLIAAFIFGFKAFYFVALALVPVAFLWMILLSRGYGS